MANLSNFTVPSKGFVGGTVTANTAYPYADEPIKAQPIRMSFDGLYKSIEDLDRAVIELVNRIESVCSPAVNSAPRDFAVERTGVPMADELMAARERIESTTRVVDDVRARVAL